MSDLMFSTKNRFFPIWPCPGHVPAWEITISATCRRLKCAPCQWNDYSNKPQLHWNPENTPGHWKTDVFYCHSIISFEIQRLLFSLIQMWSCFWEFSESGKNTFLVKSGSGDPNSSNMYFSGFWEFSETWPHLDKRETQSLDFIESVSKEIILW